MNALQSAKDSFYAALRDRLVEMNPDRTISLAGQDVPAIIVEENEAAIVCAVTAADGGKGPSPVATLADCFHLRFGAVRSLHPSSSLLAPFALDCTVSYRTRGTRDDATDRGRTLAALDTELLAIADPPRVDHRDFTQTPAADLGTPVFWNAPQLSALESVGTELRRSVQLTIFFYAQETA